MSKIKLQMQIMPYDPIARVIWATPDPAHVVSLACSVTQKGIFAEEGVSHTERLSRLIRFLRTAKHGNPLEHAVICFDIGQISRACADQLRTHRMSSPTMSSTHYQIHTGYCHRVHHNLVEDETTVKAINHAMAAYDHIVNVQKVPKEDARQLLPMSTEVRYMLTINARSLMHLLTTRLCYRNVVEMCMLANVLHGHAREWFPDLFEDVGPTCNFLEQGTPGRKCYEGKMACNFKARASEVNEAIYEGYCSRVHKETKYERM